MLSDISPTATEEFIRVCARQRGLGCLSVGIAGPDAVEHLADANTGANTTYQVGSLSKLAAAITSFRLQELGHIHLEALVSHYLPWFKLESRSVTVLDLLAHRSGLARGRLFTTDPSLADLRAALDASPRTPRRGANEAVYSNLGYGLLGHVIEAATGERFVDVVADLVFAPLSMSSSGFGHPPGSLAIPHSLRPFRANADSPFDQGPMDLHPGLAAAMGMWSTVTDVLRLVRAIAPGSRPSEDRRTLLSASSIDTLLRTASATTDGGLIGAGFRLQRAWDRRVVFENAEHFGHSASFQLLPDDGLAVVSMTNRGSAGPDLAAICGALTRQRLGGHESPSGIDRYPGAEAIDGEYVSDEGSLLSIIRREGSLFAAIDGEDASPLLYRAQYYFTKQAGALRRYPFRFVRSEGLRLLTAGPHAFSAAPELQPPILTRSSRQIDGIYVNETVGRVAVFSRQGQQLLAYSPFVETELRRTAPNEFLQVDGPFAGEYLRVLSEPASIEFGGLTFVHTGEQY